MSEDDLIASFMNRKDWYREEWDAPYCIDFDKLRKAIEDTIRAAVLIERRRADGAS